MNQRITNGRPESIRAFEIAFRSLFSRSSAQSEEGAGLISCEHESSRGYEREEDPTKGYFFFSLNDNERTEDKRRKCGNYVMINIYIGKICRLRCNCVRY